jgi:hypothetical protein
MGRYLIFSALFGIFVAIYFTAQPAMAQTKVAVIAVDLATGKFIDPNTGKPVYDYKKSGAIFGIDATLYSKLLDQAKKDKSYIPPKSLNEKSFESKYPNIKEFAKLYFTKSSPGCGWVLQDGWYQYVCDH